MTLTKYTVPKEVERKILTAIELKKELAKYEAEIKAELTQAMIDNDIYSIKNDAYSVTLASRSTYKADLDILPEEYKKVVVDTTKLGTYDKLYGTVPEGVEKVETRYITWRAK